MNREQIAALEWAMGELNDVGVLGDEGRHMDEIRRLHEALSAPKADGVTVKPLEWQVVIAGKVEWAFLPIIGKVKVEPYLEDRWEVIWSIPGMCDKLLPDVFHSLAEAKAAAQDYYEARILSAIDTSPAPKAEAVMCRHPLEAYADSYAQMVRNGDDTVDCRSVEIDIRQNMIPATAPVPKAEAVEPRRSGDAHDIANRLRAYFRDPGDARRLALDAAMMIDYLNTTPPVSALTDDAVERAQDSLLDALRENSWDLKCFDMPTGQGDADIGWRIVGHWMAAPRERIVAEVYNDDPAAAIRAALRATSPSKGDEPS